MLRKNIPPPRNAMKKYKIDELLHALTHVRYVKAMEELPALLDKCRNTFTNYRAIEQGSKKSMPYEAGILIERYFGIEPGSLLND
jgi:hypothetical protein